MFSSSIFMKSYIGIKPRFANVAGYEKSLLLPIEL